LTKPRVFVYVQHLLGIGHLKRAAVLARSLAAQGVETTLASGGPVPAGFGLKGVRLVQLPAVRAADMSFKRLLGDDGQVIDDAWRARRAAALMQAWHASKAQALVVELYPFGRRQMRFELLPLLEAAVAAAPRPAVICSVRDILGGLKTAERQEEALALAQKYFDKVLVHGDARVLPFERTFPLAPRIAARVVHTGFVVEDAPAAQGDAGKGEVVVSAGGGVVGAPLLEAALHAKPLCALRDRTWRVLAGNNLPDEDFRRIGALASAQPGVIFERSRADFTTLLANCALSVSQAGYNTLMETVQARAPAVVVPFARGETEQTLRARCFAARGLLEMVEEESLTPQTLAAAIDRAARRPAPAAGAIDLDGARKSAALIAQLAQERIA
jgi:predicted glycosyltransferase